jgi:membrane-associated protein
MESVVEFFQTILDSERILHVGGLTLLLIIVFAETGLFFGFFLPGDYLLFTAGLFCGTNDLDVNIFTLLISVTLAATAGNYVGYATGRSLGPRLFRKEDSLFFKKSYLNRTKKFFDKYSASALIIGRFLPVIRTFIPVLSGAIILPLRKFSLYNIIGGVLWVWSLIPMGYFLGRRYPQIINYIEFIVVGFVVVTTAAVIRGYYKMKRESNEK